MGVWVEDIHSRAADSHLLDLRTERRERLAYLADMLSELQVIAASEGCETLAGLLALSHTEALRKASV